MENASVLLPPAYLVRIAGYKLAWENVPGENTFSCAMAMENQCQFKKMMIFSSWERIPYGECHEMYRFAQRQTGMSWSEMWEQFMERTQ